MNTIESSVTKLLVSTKHLLEGLTHWSQNKATEMEVSDAYVKLGGDFKVACRAFANQGVDVSDLGDVPHQLRVILEEALCEPPSRETLDRFLPQIRQLIVNLLKNLKKKQGLVQTLANKRSMIQNGGTPAPRYASMQQLSPQQQQQDPQKEAARRQSNASNSSSVASGGSIGTANIQNNSTGGSPKFPQNARLSSSKYPPESLPRQRIESYRALSEGSSASPSKRLSQQTQMRATSVAPQSSSEISVNNYPSTPSIQVRSNEQLPSPINTDLPSVSINEIVSPESEALKQLQNGDMLKRRASKRFSAYQYAKLTKQSEIPLPKDINNEESSGISGVSVVHKNTSLLTPTSSNFHNTNTLSIPEEAAYPVRKPQASQQQIPQPQISNMSQMSNISTNNADISFISNSSMVNPGDNTNTTTASTDTVVKKSASSQSLTSRNDIYYIYLRYNNRTKKVKMESVLTFNSLKLLFIEKFAYTSSGDNFPEIFVQSLMNEIPYELEDDLNFMNEVSKNGYIFSLNVNNIGNLENMFKDLDSKVSTLNSSFEILQNGFSKETLSDLIKDSVKEIIKSELKNFTPASKPLDSKKGITKNGPSNRYKKMSDGFDLTSIKKELNTIKKISSDTKKEYVGTIQTLLSQIEEFKKNALETSASVNREHMQNCHNKLSEDSDIILTNVDDLQDMMEALRKDVAQHGSRPSESQLTSIKKEIKDAETSIETMHDYIIHEKPTWKSIWEKELDVVCEEQQFFKLQEDLVDDLKEDLEKVMETFTLVEHVAKEHEKKSKANMNGNSSGNSSINFKQPILPLLEPGTSLTEVKDQVLSEVTSIIPNHEDRLNAIAKTERLRQFEIKNISNSKNKFEKELNSFVEDKKFNSTGGIEEVERARQLKDEENLKGIFGVF